MTDNNPPKLTESQKRRVRFFDRLSRIAKATQASAEMVANVIENAEKVVDDVLADSLTLAEEATALGSVALERSKGMGRSIISTPRLTRIVKEVMWVVATYKIQAKKHQLLGTTSTPAATHRLHAANADRLYRMCVELRGALIKLGQLASARVDLLPEPYIEKLSLLQDQVPPVPTPEIRARIEKELGSPIEKLFETFDDEPLAAASLGQVHRARLKSGDEVVVKVQVPGVDLLVESDLAALRVIAAALKDLLPQVDLITIANEITRSVRLELDYELEASNATAFHDKYQDRKVAVIPRVFDERCSKRVLTLEWLEGKRLIPYLDACLEDEDGEDDRDWLFELLVKGYASQILEHGLFHTDPHPGNFLVLPGPSLGWLDFGSVQVYGADVRKAYADLAGAIMVNDPEKMAELFEVLGFSGQSGQREELAAFAKVFMAAFRDDLAGNMADLDPQDQMEKAMAFVRDNPIVQIPQHFVMLGRVFATVAGYVLHYKPNLSLYKVLLPYLANAMQQVPSTPAPE